MMSSGSESNFEEFDCSDRSSNDEEKANVFVASVVEEHLSSDEHDLDDTDALTYDELCIKSESLFYKTCNVKDKNIELNKKLTALQKENESFHLDQKELVENVVSLEGYVKALRVFGFVYDDKIENMMLLLLLKHKFWT